MDSFSHALEKLEGARRYISAFGAPLQELSPAQVHAMRACSLLVIPPPKEREPPPGGFPKDLSDLNLSSWAGLVQDVASGLLVPPPNLGSEVSLPAVALLELLEKTTGWVYCHFCYHLGSRCACMGAYPLSWSQVVGESPGYRATASSGGMTAPSTPAAGVSGYLPPPPGLPPIDFSKWRLLPPEGSGIQRTHSPTKPPWGWEVHQFEGHSEEDCGGTPPRQTGPTDTSAACVDTVRAPDGTASLTTMPGVASHTLPSSGTTAKEACTTSPTNKTAPVGDAPDHGRPSTRGRGGSSQSVSHPRGVPGKASVQPPHQEGNLPSGLTPSVPPPPPPAPERTQSQRGGWPRSALHDPVRLAVNFRSSGWRKALEHILRVYYRFSVASFMEAEWARVKERFFDHFIQHKGEALALKEAHPMDFMAYIQDLFY